MAYHQSKTDYSGRTVDLLLLQYVPVTTADAVVSLSVDKDPRMVTGIEKMVQRFALTFLTQVGTVKNVESEGTDFIQRMANGKIYDLSTLQTSALLANRAALQQIRSEDSTLDTPDDEALASSEVTDLSIDRATATANVTITLTSEAGDTYTYITPIATGL